MNGDDTCGCGERAELMGLDGDSNIYRCVAGHIYRTTDPYERPQWGQ